MKRVFLLRAQLWFALAVLLIGVQSGVAQNWIQWSSTNGGNNHYYALTPFATNWEAAEKLAVSWGGTLATITSSNEQRFINDTFLKGALEHRPVWIGLVDPPKHGPFSMKAGPVRVTVGGDRQANFEWVTGESLTYTNWRPGQPDNMSPGENYVAINWFYSDNPPRGLKGDWNDAPPNGTTGYGGTTDGPYFGIVERDYDPRLPVPMFTKTQMHVGLLIALAVGLMVYLVFFRRRKRAVG